MTTAPGRRSSRPGPAAPAWAPGAPRWPRRPSRRRRAGRSPPRRSPGGCARPAGGWPGRPGGRPACARTRPDRLGSRSSRSTARPALAAWAAMAAPMVPAPSTATERMSWVKDAPPGDRRSEGTLEAERTQRRDPAMSEQPPASTDFYRIDDLLTDAEREVRDRVRAFCDKEVTPIINDYWERAEFPFELVPKLAALNLAGGTIEGYGCPGLSTVAAGLVGMELGRGDGSICTFFGVHSGLAMTSINLLGVGGAEAALAAGHGPDGEDRRLRPDRARPRLGRGRAGDQRPPRRRPLGAGRGQALDRQRLLRRPGDRLGPRRRRQGGRVRGREGQPRLRGQRDVGQDGQAGRLAGRDHPGRGQGPGREPAGRTRAASATRPGC